MTKDLNKCGRLVHFSTVCFNLFIIISGLAVSTFVFWTCYKLQHLLILLTSSNELWLHLNIVLLLVSAILAILASSTVLIRQNCCLLVTHAWILALVLLLSLTAFLLSNSMSKLEFSKALKPSVIELYGYNEAVTEALDAIQNEYECCGAEGQSDWSQSLWYKSGVAKTNLVPDSCCKTPSLHCGIRNHPSNIDYTGCETALSVDLRPWLHVMGVVGLGLAVMAGVGVMLAHVSIGVGDNEPNAALEKDGDPNAINNTTESNKCYNSN